jgi:hypothetical protein
MADDLENKALTDNSKHSSLLWGSRCLKGNEEKIALCEELAAGAFLMSYFGGSSLENLKQSARSMRHAAMTVSDAVNGGPEGMRAALTLDRAVKLVEQSSKTNKNAAQALDEYNEQTRQFLEKLVMTYVQNETVKRQAQRFSTQIRGAVKHFSEFLGDMKPEVWRQYFDVPGYIGYGKVMQAMKRQGWEGLTNDQIIAKVIDTSETMKLFYKRMNDFYTAREANENTVSSMCAYLSQVHGKAEKENSELEKLYPKLLGLVKETLKKEDIVLETDAKGANMTKGNAQSIQGFVSAYQKDVDNMRAEAAEAVPFKPYHSGEVWINYGLDPLTVGVAAALILNAARRLLLPKSVEQAVSRSIALPVKFTGNCANRLYSKISSYIRRKDEND